MNAKEIIKKALNCELSGHILEAQILYEDGITKLQELVSEEKRPQKQEIYHRHLRDYRAHLQEIRDQIKQHMLKSKLVNHVQIAENSRGHSYNTLFGHFLNGEVKEVHLYEPYLMDRTQFTNLINFLELIVKNCPNLRYVRLFTKTETKSLQKQINVFNQIRQDIASGNISFNYKFDDTLHDRKIVLSNGVCIKIGRGLHFFKPNAHPFTLGLCDFDYCKCRQTEIDIWRSRPYAEAVNNN